MNFKPKGRFQLVCFTKSRSSKPRGRPFPRPVSSRWMRCWRMWPARPAIWTRPAPGSCPVPLRALPQRAWVISTPISTISWTSSTSWATGKNAIAISSRWARPCPASNPSLLSTGPGPARPTQIPHFYQRGLAGPTPLFYFLARTLASTSQSRTCNLGTCWSGSIWLPRCNR